MKTKRRTKTRKTVIVLLLLLIALAVVSYRLASFKPETPPLVTPIEAKKAEDAMDRVKATAESVAVNATEGRHVPFKIEVSGEDLTNYAASNPRVQSDLQSKSIKQPHVEFVDGRAVISGIVEAGGRDIYVTAIGTPVPAAGGGVELADVQVKVGKLNASAFLADKVKAAIDQTLKSGQTRLMANVTSVEAEHDTLAITGVSQPE